MKIKFLQDVELECFGFSSPNTDIENFKSGEITDIDIRNDEKTEIQFGDGSVSFVNDDFWKVVEVLEED